MKAILIKCAPVPGRNPIEVPGWLVPETEDLFGVDMRHEADFDAIPPQPPVWAITHLPTGMRVNKGVYTNPAYSFDACEMARRFYAEYKAREWNIHSTDPTEIVAPYKKLSHEEANAFWEEVAGWPKKLEPNTPTSCEPSSEKP